MDAMRIPIALYCDIISNGSQELVDIIPVLTQWQVKEKQSKQLKQKGEFLIGSQSYNSSHRSSSGTGGPRIKSGLCLFPLVPFRIGLQRKQKAGQKPGNWGFPVGPGSPQGSLFGERRGMEPLLVTSLKQTGPLGLPISISCLNVLLPELNTEPTGKGAQEIWFAGVGPLSEPSRGRLENELHGQEKQANGNHTA